MEDLWDVKRVAEHLGVTTRTVYSKLRSGEIPAIRLGGRWRFRPADIDAWLGAKATPLVHHAAVREERPGPRPTRDDLVALLAGIADPLERRLAFVGLLSQAIERAGGTPPVIVGGQAVEFYTAGGYTTVDIDVAGASEPIAETLAAWGFERSGRHWYEEALGLVIEAPTAQLDVEAAGHVLEVEVRGVVTRLIGIEDLIVDRLAACVHWSDAESCMWARALVQAHVERIDVAYLRQRAAAEDVAGVLEAVLDEVVQT